MTILWGDTGKVSTGTLKTFTFTQPEPRFNNMTGGGEVTIPATESASGGVGTVSYTILNSDLPTCTPSPYSMKYSAYLIVSGKNNGASAATIQFSLYKNGVSVASNQNHSNITASNWWTHTHYRFYDVVEGDVLEVRIWTSSSNVWLDYSALIIYPARPELTKAPIVTDLSYGMAYAPVIASGTGINPVTAVGGTWLIYPSANSPSIAVGNSVTTTFNCLQMNLSANKFAGTLSNGDPNLTSGLQVNATSHPYYYRSAVPTIVSFREMWR